MSLRQSSVEGGASGCGAHVKLVGLLALVGAVLMSMMSVIPGSAQAFAESPQWTITAISTPTNLPPGGAGTFTLEVKNTGGAPTDGSEITVTDALPSGLTLQAGSEASGHDFLSGNAVSCTGSTCKYSGVIVPGDYLLLSIPVQAGAPASVTNTVTATGGGAPEATRATPTTISATSASFGIAPGSTATALSTTQAGAHADLTTSLAVTTDSLGLLSGHPKETGLDLPPGFVINVGDTPQCSTAEFSQEGDNDVPTCALSTQVGTAVITLNLTPIYGFPVVTHIQEPLFNLTPNPGEIARVGFFAAVFGVQATISVQPGNYAGRTTFKSIRTGFLEGASITVWGAPSDSVHDAMRGLVCGLFCTVPGGGNMPSTSPPVPFFTNATQCTGEPVQSTFFTKSYEEPEVEVTAPSSFGVLAGCDLLEFPPAVRAAPDTTRADTPAGLTFEVKVPQEGLVSSEGLSATDIKDTKVTLPEGVVINPGQAAGLAACQMSQAGIGLEGPPSCPSNSKVGHVEVESPLLKNKLEGEVYVLQSNPPHLKLLVAPESPVQGLYIKFVGEVHLNEATGQLVTTFENTPALPFSNLKLSFSGGAQAALATPTECGVYTTSGIFTPWNGGANALVSSSFAIGSGSGGSACPSTPLPFSPSLDAGATTDQAGGFTDFSLLLTRADDQQRIKSLQFKVPEGLLGEIAKVPLCGEPQASRGECSAASQIGHTVVEAGPGPYPLVVPQPGEPPAPIYLTGGYQGAPYGLSIVVPLEVGPFTLQTQVVRAKIEVDPLTAQLTVTTDPFPTIIDGIPADLRTIVAVIDRPGFMFNPTDCSPMAFSGTAFSVEGASVPISSHFQVGSCQALKFQPNFKVSTSGKTSKADGASLEAKIVYPTGPLGFNQASSQSNIARVKVELPKQLPSRLTTLQKACTAQVFETNPAACPQASVVGHATAVTPVLPVALTGPAYFVSHGGEAFPSLIVVLQGYGTTVDLVGSTFISKTGITSSTFKQVPDVPIYSFALTLPQGPFSALAANGNLCKSTLTMPTEFTGHNGAMIHQNTKIAVTGCPKTKRATNKRKQAKGKKKRKGKGKKSSARLGRKKA
jgi:uncharacterized repeat protein (TIGR01451 family)